jgi:hypothetical protein
MVEPLWLIMPAEEGVPEEPEVMHPAVLQVQVVQDIKVILPDPM